MQMYPLAIASAEIRHRRYLPKAPCAFETQLTYLWFDPDQPHLFTGKSWLWSSNRWNFLTLDERFSEHGMWFNPAESCTPANQAGKLSVTACRFHPGAGLAAHTGFPFQFRSVLSDL